MKVNTGKINDFYKFYDFLLLKNSRALNKNVVYRFSNFKIVGIFFIKPKCSINRPSQFHTTNQLWLFSDGLSFCRLHIVRTPNILLVYELEQNAYGTFYGWLNDKRS